MEKITTVADLRNAIQQLEYKQTNEWTLLKAEVLNVSENLKPLNLIKNTFKEATSSSEFKDSLLGSTVGLAAGYLSKSLFVGASTNPIKNVLGGLIQLGISTIVAKNPETIKMLADSALSLLNKKQENKVENQNEHSG